MSQTPQLSSVATPVKSVTFGGVTKKTFIPRESITAIRNKPQVTTNFVLRTNKSPTSVSFKSGVFSRLGS